MDNSNQSSRPNIVIFVADQWRGDVMGHMGNPAAVTPRLDRWVDEDAVSFRNAFCQNPVCTPSRCSFMSGWYPHVRGHRTMFHMMQPDEPVLLRTLKEEGYFVWWGGKNDLVPAENGFDEFCDIKYVPSKPPAPQTNMHKSDDWRGDPDGDNYYSFYVGKRDNEVDNDWACIQGAIDFIQQAPQDKPFCLYLPLLFPHPPYGVEQPYYSMIDRSLLPDRIPAPDSWEGKPSIMKGIYELQNMQRWSEDRWSELRATYYGMCARVDAQFGMLLDALKAAGSYDNTAVFFFSDHGDFTGDYGLVEKTQNTFQDCLTRVPFIVKPPKSVPVKPGIRDALIELIDFPATVEDLLGLTPAHTHFGRSLLPLIEGKTDTHRDAVFCEGGRLHGETQAMEKSSSTSKDFLYYPRLYWQQREGPQHTKAVMIRTHAYKYVRRHYEQDELYDLKSDPAELVNRIDDPSLSGVLAELQSRLLDFYVETCDVVPMKENQR